jgi:hypothetical protein
MTLQSDPRDLVRAVVITDHRAVEDSIEVVKEKHAGSDAAFAVAFEDRDGVQRRGVIGLCNHDGGAWRPSGGFMGSARVTGDPDVWMTWGGWGPGDSRESAVIGGWVADPDAVSVRLIDSTGQALEDVVENGVVLFMSSGYLNDRYARLELLDAEQRVLRAGPLHRAR